MVELTIETQRTKSWRGLCIEKRSQVYQGEGASKKGCEGVKEVRGWGNWGMVKRYKEC